MNPLRFALPHLRIALLAGLLLIPAAAGAVGTGALVVAVVDADGAPAAGVAVRALSPALLGEREAVTAAAGEARFPSLPAGSYRLELPVAPGAGVTATAEVRQGETTRVVIPLPPAGSFGEAIEIATAAPLVATATPKVSEHLDLAAARALPVARDYRGLAQLVAGVTVVPNGDGLELRAEPASKGGNNYHDRGALFGSRDNQYYLDGFQITDMGSGGGDLRLDTEALAEVEVVTSAVPAGLSGGAGYVMNLLTRSGGSRLHGTASLYVQDPSMYDSFATDDSRLTVAREDKRDAGLSLGGPLVADRLRFFASGQRRENEDRVELSTSASPTPRTEEYLATRDTYLGKLTWAPTTADTLTALYFGESRDARGSRDVNLPPNRYADSEQEFWTGILGWERLFGPAAVATARYGEQSLESRTTAAEPAAGPPNTLLFPPGVQVPAYLRNLGSSGDDGVTDLRKRQGDLSGSLFFEALGSHELTAGLSAQRWTEEVRVDLRYGVNLTSLAPSLQGLTFADARTLGFLPASEYDAIFRALAARPGSSFFLAADADRDGQVSAAEFAALRFDSRHGNLDGVNFLRLRTLYAGASAPYQESLAYYLQDEWRIRHFTVLAGVRVEDRRYYASDDSTILEMDPAWYPRAGVAWDVGGRGTQRLSLAWGRYPDPLRSSMIRFVGNLTGSVFADEVYLGGDWFDYRQRGAARLTREAAFAPNLENEEEEEIQLTYGVELAGTWGFLAQAYRRTDRNLIEDYDPAVYFNPAASGEYALRPEQFGYPPSGAGNVVFFLGNLAGGKRITEGIDLALTRRARGAWTATLQYSWKQARGNSNSDAAADLQGDFVFLDPRQPYMWGPLPGTIENQAKLFGSWRTPWRVELGGLVYWNDGAVFTEALRWRPTGSNILYNYQRPDGSWVRTGQEKHPGYTTVDLRLALPVRIGRVDASFFVDVFNALDEQDPIRVEESHNGAEFTTYREPRLLLEPRRWQLGVRLAFE
ncbi:MAG: TonB-dependent receptor [Thermoanaerobaculia bacterium]|nr:TonB-dependent receptor [Thermoanaerobaculia bacterium]